MYDDQVKYFISMKYVHGLSCLGGVKMPDGRKVLLFYKEPDLLAKIGDGLNQVEVRDMQDPVEKVEESQFAILLPSSVERGEFEQRINSVQMDLDQTYLTQTVLDLVD